MTEYRDKSGYDGIGTLLKLEKEPSSVSNDDLAKIVLGRPDPRDLSQLTQTTARIETRLQQESEERKSADAENMVYTREQDSISRHIGYAGLIIAGLSLLVAFAALVVAIIGLAYVPPA